MKVKTVSGGEIYPVNGKPKTAHLKMSERIRDSFWPINIKKKETGYLKVS